MKTPSLLTILLLLRISATGLLAQGLLTPPPGAPAPTMKTLDQIEARIPIPGGTTTFIATASGSYYLTGNLTTVNSAIDIRADNVTLDLNGFTIASAAGSTGGYGIYILGKNSATVRNGHIKGLTTYDETSYTPAGFLDGVSIQCDGTTRVENVEVTGVQRNGIFAGDTNTYSTTVISHCQVNISAGTGITAGGASTIDHCVAQYCAGTAIRGRIADSCNGYSTDNGFGISTTTARDCYGIANNETALACSVATDCIGVAIGTGKGITANKLAENCYAEASGSADALTTITATNCSGSSGGTTGTGSGIVASEATGCHGTTRSGGVGVKCDFTATNCHGTSETGIGVSAITATNCHGISSSGVGLSATTANTCYGQTSGISAASYGIDCSTTGIATGCRALAPNSSAVPTALRAFIATSCVVSGGKIAIANKYNMP